MIKCVDELIDEIIKNKSCVVVGLDPVMSRIPAIYKKKYLNNSNTLEASANVIIDYNKDVIDSVQGLVCAVKPQMAFYEMYGHYSVKAFEETVNYAKSKGIIVIEDGKRNDIGNTVKAYSGGHLGQVELINGTFSPVYDVDFLTISPFLGFESIEPFINDCERYNKGLFVLVKTSNKDSADIQDKITDNGDNISTLIANHLANNSVKLKGEKYNYSSLGAVVGATYPNEAKKLRAIMKNNIFLVPGYGAQGAEASTVVSCFNPDGLGAIISASRSVLYSYENDYSNQTCTREQLKQSVTKSCLKMRNDIYQILKSNYQDMVY